MSLQVAYSVVRLQYRFFYPHRLFPAFSEVVEVFQEGAGFTVLFRDAQGISRLVDCSSWADVLVFLRTHSSTLPTAVDGIIFLQDMARRRHRKVQTPLEALVHYDPTQGGLRRVESINLDLPAAAEREFLTTQLYREFKQVVDTLHSDFTAPSIPPAVPSTKGEPTGSPRHRSRREARAS
jgi:hypothetical protein